MTEKFKSKALEANLAETRYKDVKIEPEYLNFVDLSKNYFGINKRALDCIIEFQHPFSNRKFVTEELRNILLTDYWFYIALDNPNKAFSTPIKILGILLKEQKSFEYHVLITRTILEFVQKLSVEKEEYIGIIDKCLKTVENGLEQDPLSSIKSSKYFNRYLTKLASLNHFKKQLFNTNVNIYKTNIEYWESHTRIEDWIIKHKDILTVDHSQITNKLGKIWFNSLKEELATINDWNTLVDTLPDYDSIADRFASSVSLFSVFIEKFYYSFYLLQLEGMDSHKERIIWNLNKMLQQTVDEVDKAKIVNFIDQILFYICFFVV